MSAPEPDRSGAGDGDPKDERDPLKRRIAVSLAAVVVLGGGLAILQRDAGVNESNSARETTRVAVRAMRSNVALNTLLGVQSELQGERDFLPFRRPLTAGVPGLAAAAGFPPRPGQVERDLRAAQLALPIKRTERALDGFRFAAERETLKQQALATTRIAWNERSTQYTTVIAVLAAALFLVGFGLIVEGPIRRYSYLLGVAVALFAVGWAVWIYLLPIPSTPDGAVAAAARGAVLTGDGRYAAAVGAYDGAIEADDTYAAAYTGRARARLLAANPDYPSTRAFTDTEGRGSVAAVEDAVRGLELGGHRDLLGFSLVALAAFYRGEYEQAVEAADRALAINPKVPDVWLLKSAAEAGLGERQAADESLTRAIDLLRGSEPSQRTRLLASSYLSYLAWVAWKEPGRAGAAKRLSDRAVAVETAFTLGRKLSDSPPRRGRVHVDDLRFADGRLTLLLRWKNLPGGTALSAVGYERPLTKGAWTQPSDLALFADLGGSGKRRISVPLQRVCKPTQVRADIFLNGAPALSRIGPGVPATC